MGGGLRIGRILGIGIFIDWSWIIIFVLVTWNLAAGVLPQWHPEWNPALSWSVAAAGAILFFASVLLHELSHSVVAKAQGLPVRRITLFMFGGVSSLEREPSSSRSEFLIAAVGPLTSILLGVVFFALATIAADGLIAVDSLASISRLDPLSTLLLWLGPINVLVGLFNLVPGFPLDGGRILRSLLWWVTGSLRRATRWAAGVGQFIAWLFIFAGIAMILGVSIPIFGAGLLGGFWLAFIGWFLNNAAIASYRQVIIHDLLEDMTVSRLMRRDVPTVTADLSIGELVYDQIMNTDSRAFVVMEGDRIAGLITIEDVRNMPREEWNSTTVGAVMTPADRLVMVSPEEDAVEALTELASRDIRQLPVVRNGKLIGMLRRRDVVKWLQLQSDVPLR